ncbi:mandelate racemase/muconate lactonizing enzyme family protein [soil metagenome]
MKITAVETDLLRVPLPRPVALPASQDPRPATHADFVIVRLLTDSSHVGLGMTYSLSGDGAALCSLITSRFADIVTGEDPLRIEWLFAKASAELADVGFSGLVSRAYAAVDFALWDLKGKVAGLPVHSLLGGYRTKLKAILADTATPAVGVKQAVKDTKKLLDAGAAGLQIEVGTQDPDMDVERMRQLKDALPEGPWIEVSAAGRYDFSSALWMGRVFEEEFGIDSYLDPLRPHDLVNLERLTQRLELSLGVGAYVDRVEDFQTLLGVAGISALRIDPVRLGGLTPARKVAIAAELKNVAITPVRLPEIGVHLACGVVWGRVCEYVDWFSDLFTGGPRFDGGQLVAPETPGLGIALNQTIAAKHRV